MISGPKIILWIGGASVLSLAVFIIVMGFQQEEPHSLAQEAASPPPARQEATPSQRVQAPNVLESTPTATPEVAAFAQVEKIEKLSTYRQARQNLRSAPTPVVEASMETQLSSAANYLQALGQRVEVFEQTRNDLRKALSAEEKARLHAEENPTPNEEDNSSP